MSWSRDWSRRTTKSLRYQKSTRVCARSHEYKVPVEVPRSVRFKRKPSWLCTRKNSYRRTIWSWRMRSLGWKKWQTSTSNSWPYFSFIDSTVSSIVASTLTSIKISNIVFYYFSICYLLIFLVFPSLLYALQPIDYFIHAY